MSSVLRSRLRDLQGDQEGSVVIAGPSSIANRRRLKGSGGDVPATDMCALCRCTLEPGDLRWMLPGQNRR